MTAAASVAPVARKYFFAPEGGWRCSAPFIEIVGPDTVVYRGFIRAQQDAFYQRGYSFPIEFPGLVDPRLLPIGDEI
jgi:hypothetical protein